MKKVFLFSPPHFCLSLRDSVAQKKCPCGLLTASTPLRATIPIFKIVLAPKKLWVPAFATAMAGASFIFYVLKAMGKMLMSVKAVAVLSGKPPNIQMQIGRAFLKTLSIALWPFAFVLFAIASATLQDSVANTILVRK